MSTGTGTGRSEGKCSKGSLVNGSSEGTVPLAIVLDPAPTGAPTGASKAAPAVDGPLKRFTPFDYGCTSKPRSTLWKPTNRSDQGSANGGSQRGTSPDSEHAERTWPDSPGSASSCLPVGPPGLGIESEDGFDNLFPLTARPVDFHDPYLFPTLSQDERDRLTAFHRVSQGLEEDPVLMQHLAELVTIIKDIFAYEIVIIGIFDSDAYIQIVADGYPKLVVPRRESTCAHTILQPPGTVLNITDMANDWRFAESPPVAIGGLRTYAGTPLVHHAAQTGDPVAVGSVCIASFKTKPPLTDAQKSILVRFGKAIMHAINSVATRTEEARQRQFRDVMTDLTSLGTDPKTVVERALAALRLTHPQCRAKLVTAKEGSLELQGEGAVSLTDFDNSLWENMPLIDYWFTWKNNQNSKEGESQRTTRALACLVTADQYLVLESSAIPNVFQGGVDVLFLRSVAMVVAGGFQARQLQEALEAKESFLRDVQHSLRTSLNGVLSASEMLLDDIGQSTTTPRLSPSLSAAAPVASAAPPRAVLANGPAPFPSTHMRPMLNCPAGPTATPATHEDLLTIIDASGRELLTVINSLLGFQTTPLLIKPNSELCNLTELEEEVCEPALQACSRYQLSRVTLIVRNEIPDHLDTLATDLTLFRQIVSILLQNAVDATDLGTVVLSVRLATDGNAVSPTALVVEVQDTGAGIAEEHRERIFEPFYKANAYSSRAGLGLSFAKRYAEALGGSINIIATEVGKGSTVRFTLPNPILTRSDECAPDQHRELLASRKYYMCPRPPPWEAVDRDIALALGKFGCQPVQAAEQADLIVQDAGAGSASEEEALAALQGHQCLLRLVSVAVARNRALVFSSSGAGAERIVYCHLPLYKKRVQASMMALGRALQRMHPDSKIATVESAKGTAMGTAKRGREQLRVLVVDDNEFNLKILSSFCRKKLYDHVGARDGREAYEAYVRAHAAGRPFTFCAMDLQMPECDGLEATRLIRQYEKEQGLQPCHVHMITGQSGEDDRKASVAVGCDGFHVKPVRMKQLDDLVSLHFRSE